MRPEPNPILIKCVRARMRWKHALPWGLVTVSVASFLTTLVYWNGVEHQLFTPQRAALATLPGLIVFQGVLLMLLGTGAVASGMVRERSEGLLDYHRMTPMRPAAKILGFLFGLPAREYFLFVLTLPFVAFAVWKGGLALHKLAHFYAIFFLSVCVYHLTGMVAGMLFRRSRRAAMFAQVMVLLLYFVLPQLHFVGIPFFEYLTARPTFFRMIENEVGAGRLAPGSAAALVLPREVPFFAWRLHPSLYTALVQSFIVWILFTVVHRKWAHESSHPFSKVEALVIHLVVTTLLAAGLWPLVGDRQLLRDTFPRLRGADDGQAVLALYIATLVAALLSLGVATLLVVTTTPSRGTRLRALWRARKHGRARPRFGEDGASSVWVACALAAVTVGAGTLWLRELAAAPGLLLSLPAGWTRWAPAVLFLAITLLVQGAAERFGPRGLFVTGFLFWVLPVLAGIVVGSARQDFSSAVWTALPSAPVDLWLALAAYFDDAVAAGTWPPDYVPADLAGELPRLAALGVGVQVGLAALAQGLRFAGARRLRRIALEGAPPPRAGTTDLARA